MNINKTLNMNPAKGVNMAILKGDEKVKTLFSSYSECRILS